MSLTAALIQARRRSVSRSARDARMFKQERAVCWQISMTPRFGSAAPGARFPDAHFGTGFPGTADEMPGPCTPGDCSRRSAMPSRCSRPVSPASTCASPAPGGATRWRPVGPGHGLLLWLRRPAHAARRRRRAVPKEGRAAGRGRGEWGRFRRVGGGARIVIDVSARPGPRAQRVMSCGEPWCRGGARPVPPPAAPAAL